MKVACLFTDSIYTLVVSDRGGTKRDVLDLGFTGAWETTGGDGMARVGSAERGGISETFIKTEVGVSGTGGMTGMDVGTSDYALPALVVLASDPRTYLSPHSADSWLVLRVVSLWRFCNTSVGGRSGNSEGSGTFSSGMGLPQKKRFQASKRALISAKIVSILAE